MFDYFPLHRLIFSVIILKLAAGFNPCNVDDSICMPLEDFEENCTCLLLSDGPINVTDDLYMFMTGYPIHMSYIKQTELQPLFRKKLDVRIPSSRFYEDTFDFPERLFQSMDIEENMAFFEADSSKIENVVNYLIENGLIRTKALSTKENRWCLEGECNAFVFETGIINRTQGIYSYTADLLEIIEYRGRSIVAVSNVSGKLSIPKVQQYECHNRCKVFYWNENSMCKKQCELRVKFDQIAMTSEMKRNFDFFIQSSTILNFRNKYKKYLS
ncbi:unnamed protein product [Caenorhabditis bovis]|uniref:Uncharacterized protein n=1 Tax=Caenorhabditis bovis TaxID=2654633 RepID=A0A8S1EF34_9PELO|nr:unnamed protein product [Caenorhabditis bovis]